jgi:hypothetical protein
MNAIDRWFAAHGMRPLYGAEGGSRTRTGFHPSDFESDASACSATPAAADDTHGSGMGQAAQENERFTSEKR